MSSIELAVLCADLNIEQVVRTLLTSRSRALGISAPTRVRHLRHPNKDPGCFGSPGAVLGARNMARRALVLFDTAFGGAPQMSADEMSAEVERKLSAIWGTEAKAVAIAPEIEAWLWAGHHTAEALRWTGGYADLRRWLVEEELWDKDAPKPRDPKEAIARVVRRTAPGPSRGLFEHVAAKASVEACIDPSFLRLRSILREWFPA